MGKCCCGSGLDRYGLYDRANCFCAWVCEECEDRVKATFNPVIFGSVSVYEAYCLSNGETLFNEEGF